MMDALEGVEATALLVNESRARSPALSGDRFAREWIPDAWRDAVGAMWDRYALDVYPHDDVIVSVRNRAVVNALERAVAHYPQLVLLNIGAGFTSYPWLLPISRSIEVDLPAIVTAKQTRAAKLRELGRIPSRDVRYLAADLATPEAADRIVQAVHALPDVSSVAVVIEGLLYYLPQAACEHLLSLASNLDRRVVSVIISFWPLGSSGNRVLRQQAEWFQSNGISPSATFLSTDEVRSALGRGVIVRGPVELQRTFGHEPVVAERDLVPEYLAEWELH